MSNPRGFTLDHGKYLDVLYAILSDSEGFIDPNSLLADRIDTLQAAIEEQADSTLALSDDDLNHIRQLYFY